MKNFILALLFSFWISLSFAQSNIVIPYSGQISDTLDAPIVGLHDFTFKIGEQSGPPLWTETHSLEVIQGAYFAELGNAGTPLPLSLFQNPNPLYLSLSIDAGPDLLPLIPILEVPFSVMSRMAETLIGDTIHTNMIFQDSFTVVDTQNPLNWLQINAPKSAIIINDGNSSLWNRLNPNGAEWLVKKPSNPDVGIILDFTIQELQVLGNFMVNGRISDSSLNFVVPGDADSALVLSAPMHLINDAGTESARMESVSIAFKKIDWTYLASRDGTGPSRLLSANGFDTVGLRFYPLANTTKLQGALEVDGQLKAKNFSTTGSAYNGRLGDSLIRLITPTNSIDLYGGQDGATIKAFNWGTNAETFLHLDPNARQLRLNNSQEFLMESSFDLNYQVLFDSTNLKINETYTHLSGINNLTRSINLLSGELKETQTNGNSFSRVQSVYNSDEAYYMNYNFPIGNTQISQVMVNQLKAVGFLNAEKLFIESPLSQMRMEFNFIPPNQQMGFVFEEGLQTQELFFKPQTSEVKFANTRIFQVEIVPLDLTAQLDDGLKIVTLSANDQISGLQSQILFDPTGAFNTQNPGTSQMILGEDVKINGDLQIAGNISKASGTFVIDHPQDPENKLLYHSFVESPDMMNIYNGNIKTDKDGFAKVELPAYFESLNMDFRYQLTAIGEFANIIVKEKIKGNQFTIQSSVPNIEVSWQVTGVRNDDYAKENRVKVEVEKPEAQKGTRLFYPSQSRK